MICRLVGCTSPFARWFEWPARLCSWRACRELPMLHETDPTEPPPPVLRHPPMQDVGGMGPPDDDD